MAALCCVFSALFVVSLAEFLFHRLPPAVSPAHARVPQQVNTHMCTSFVHFYIIKQTKQALLYCLCLCYAADRGSVSAENGSIDQDKVCFYIVL